MSNIIGKRLLVLGGTVSTYDVVLHAKQRGAYVIVTDYLADGEAKKIADETAMISTSDINALEEFALRKRIDGVFTGCSELNIKFVQQLCMRLKLPFYATEKQFDISMNKKHFKQLCRVCSIPVAEEYIIKDSSQLNEIRNFPIIVKPVDGCSSKGISICNNNIELKQAYEDAKSHSVSGDIIIEKYIQGYDDVCMYYTIQNGYLTLSAMTDRNMNDLQAGKAPQPNALFFPSKYLEVYYEVLHEKVKKFVKELSLQNGTMFIQAFVKEHEFIAFEMGYRLCGANEYVIVSRENEINTLDMYLNMALTGKFDGWDNREKDNPYFRQKYCILVPLLKSGTIRSCSGIDKIRQMNEVIYIQQFYHEGDTILEQNMGTLNQTFARIYICADSDWELRNSIHKVQDYLEVKDINGNEMLLPGLWQKTSTFL